MSKVTDLMNKLKRKRFAPPSRTDGWFTMAEACEESGISEKTTAAILKDATKDGGALEARDFVVWDVSRNCTVHKTYYREKTAKVSKETKIVQKTELKPSRSRSRLVEA